VYIPGIVVDDEVEDTDGITANDVVVMVVVVEAVINEYHM